MKGGRDSLEEDKAIQRKIRMALARLKTDNYKEEPTQTKLTAKRYENG